MMMTRKFKAALPLFLALSLALGLSAGLFAENVRAAMSPIVTVSGQLYNVNDKTIELKNSTGVVKVPRSAIKDQNSLKSNAFISVRVPLAALVYYNEKHR